jgi:hypothetical protein
VGGPGTVRGLRRAGAQSETNLTVSVKEDRPS